MTSFDSSRPDFAPYGLTCVRWEPSAMLRPDRHNEIEINLLASGSVTYLLGGRKVRVAAENMSLFWAAIPHQIIAFEDTAQYFVVTLPLAWFIQCRFPSGLVQPLLRGELLSESQRHRARSDLAMLSDWSDDLAHPTAYTERAVLLELEARLWRVASSIAQPVAKEQRRDASAVELTRVEQMACYIAQQYTRPLNVEDVSRQVGLHPNYAMSLFKRSIGATIVDYVTQHRVSHAQRLLVTTDAKIVDIAMNSGFSSMSRFNAAFREECGCSPRNYRAQHRLMQ